MVLCLHLETHIHFFSLYPWLPKLPLGYGNAAGLFNRHGLLGSSHPSRKVDMSEDEPSDTEEYKECEKDIDLVTAGKDMNMILFFLLKATILV